MPAGAAGTTRLRSPGPQRDVRRKGIHLDANLEWTRSSGVGYPLVGKRGNFKVLGQVPAKSRGSSSRLVLSPRTLRRRRLVGGAGNREFCAPEQGIRVARPAGLGAAPHRDLHPQRVASRGSADRPIAGESTRQPHPEFEAGAPGGLRPQPKRGATRAARPRDRRAIRCGVAIHRARAGDALPGRFRSSGGRRDRKR